MKKLFSLFTAFILSLTMMTSVGAIGLTPIEDETNLCIETAAVPDNVTTYAADIFMHMSKSVWSSFGIFGSQLNNLSLSQGFRMISVNTMRYSDIAYYFLVYSGDSVVAIMTISNVNGKLGFQIERNLLTVDISERMRPSAQPYKIYVSDNAYYFVQSNRIIHTSSEEYLYDKDKIANDCAVISNNIASCSDNVMNTTIANTGAPIATCSFSNSVDSSSTNSVLLSVVHVSNEKVEYTITVDGKEMIDEQWVCWAASTASLCNYYKRGCPDTYSQFDLFDAESIKKDLINERLATNSDLLTNIFEIVPFINERLPTYGYGDLKYAYTHSILPWNVVKNSLNAKRPSVTAWVNRDNNNNAISGHALVLKGYSYPPDNPTQDSYYMMHFMDPNTQAISTPSGNIYPPVCIGYNTHAYTTNNVTYVWEETTCLNSYK